METQLLQQVKGCLYDLCGQLSIEEIMSNPDLIRVIESATKRLLGAGA